MGELLGFILAIVICTIMAMAGISILEILACILGALAGFGNDKK